MESDRTTDPWAQLLNKAFDQVGRTGGAAEDGGFLGDGVEP